MERISISFALANSILESQGNSFLRSQIEFIEEDVKEQHNYSTVTFVDYEENKLDDKQTEFILFFDVE